MKRVATQTAVRKMWVLTHWYEKAIYALGVAWWAYVAIYGSFLLLRWLLQG